MDKSNIKRRIFHVDMNSFFASCEEANNPELKGKKIAVAGDPKKRHGIILAASYPAKADGVYTTMPIWKALNVCPDLIITECHMDLYISYSNAMLKILESYAPVIEKASVDEAYLDLTGTEELYPDLYKLAEEIQKRIYDELGLKCSIGISENKLLAKMGSDFKKPMGITVMMQEDVPNKLWKLDVGDLFLVGKSTKAMLNKIGIFTIGQLANFNMDVLKRYFKEKGAIKLKNFACGIDDDPVIPRKKEDAKSKGAEYTFSEDEDDIEKFKQVFFAFSEKIAKNLREWNKYAKTVIVKIKYENFTIITRNYTMKKATNLSNDIYNNALKLFEKNWDRRYKIRLIGLSCSNFQENKDDFEQMTLFNSFDLSENGDDSISLYDSNNEKEEKIKEKLNALDKVSDILREKYGDDIVLRAKTLNILKRNSSKNSALEDMDNDEEE